MPLVGAIDQGTSSSRFLVFDLKDDTVVAQHQIPVTTILPKEGWVEQDPLELLDTVTQCLAKVQTEISEPLKAIGITNQRETTVVWDRTTGVPLHNAIIWLDVRTEVTVEKICTETGKDKNALRDICGLPISTYFSALKLRWLIDHVESVAKAMREGTLMFGTVDSWLIWNLTGGVDGGVHVTDVTNASRTMLMNLKTRQWDPELLDFFKVPIGILPEIKRSAEVYGLLKVKEPKLPEDLKPSWAGIPISGCLGDQQAALVGHQCFHTGMAKNTYGTGCFMLFNTGEKIVTSTHGMLSTVAFQFDDDQPIYALEGSIAVAGAAVKWAQDNLGIISSPPEIEKYALSERDNAGVYFVPAFSGLFAPHWRPDARGVISGLTQYSNRGHICRAILESICYQTREITDCMNRDSELALQKLVVDGAMTKNNLLMQIQSDFLGIEVIRPEMVEVTALGAAYAAGYAVGVWKKPLTMDMEEAKPKVIFNPQMPEEARKQKYRGWKVALQKSLTLEPHNLKFADAED